MYYVELHERIVQETSSGINEVLISCEGGMKIPIIPYPGTTLYLTQFGGTEFNVERLEIIFPDEDYLLDEEEFVYLLHSTVNVSNDKDFDEYVNNYLNYNRKEWYIVYERKNNVSHDRNVTWKY